MQLHRAPAARGALSDPQISARNSSLRTLRTRASRASGREILTARDTEGLGLKRFKELKRFKGGSVKRQECRVEGLGTK